VKSSKLYFHLTGSNRSYWNIRSLFNSKRNACEISIAPTNSCICQYTNV